jgi:hypothetical protein
MLERGLCAPFSLNYSKLMFLQAIPNQFNKVKTDKKFRQKIKESRFWKRMHWKYKSPSGYAEWKDLVFGFSTVSSYEHLSGSFYAGDSNGLVCNLCLQAASFVDAPAVYLRRELGEALLATDIEAMEPPNKVLDALFVVLPKNLLKGDQNEPIDCLLIVNEELFKPFILAAQKRFVGMKLGTASSGNGLRVFGMDVSATGMLFQSAAPWSQPTTETSGNYENPYAEISDYDAFDEVCKKMMRIAKNIILLYNHERHLVKEEPSSSFVPAKKRKASDKRPFPVTWLGSDFKAKQASHENNKVFNETARPVRAHWRKGHWHRYWCGEGRRKQITRWVQPVYVGKVLL